MEKLVWKAVACSKRELRLDYTLEGGQSFRWQKMDDHQWRGVFADKIWTLKQNDEQLLYHVIPKSTNDEDVQALNDYFQLGVNLGELFGAWSKSDDHFCSIASAYAGVRVLRQNPEENVFSFLCTSNNHIQRITSMVEKLCTLYGKEIAQMDGRTYYTFPKAENMTNDSVEGQLKEQKFGFRAKYIADSAKLIAQNGGAKLLFDLRSQCYEDARAALLTLPGVGPKVADCVCLMSLDKTQSVPIDTHMFQIAARSYLPSLKKYKTLTDKGYIEIGDHFRTLFGSYAGWAHSVLFTSDLPKFQQQPPKMEKTHKSKTSSPSKPPTSPKRKKSK